MRVLRAKLEKERKAKGKGMNYNVQIENYDVNVQFVVEATFINNIIPK